jgi:hypothetical protein
MDTPSQIIHLRPIKSANQYLYHYTRADTAVQHILATGTLRMSPFTAVNDPWEAKHWFVEALFNDAGDDPTALEFMMLTASPALKGACKLLCFTRDAPEATGCRHRQSTLIPARCGTEVFADRECGLNTRAQLA